MGRPRFAWAVLALAICARATEPATITGRVFDTYHRPVRSARVVTMERRTVGGRPRLVPGASAVVNDAGMYRLTLPPGRYVLAVTPPPAGTDFATVFPAYFGDTVDFNHAQPVDLRPGEIRAFVDFLLLEVESHRIGGHVTGVPAGSPAVTVALYAATGYTEELRTVPAGTEGGFLFDHVPAGSYELKAGTAPLGQSRWYGSAHVEVAAPEIRDIRIHLRPRAR